jgi:hypothetical protein
MPSSLLEEGRSLPSTEAIIRFHALPAAEVQSLSRRTVSPTVEKLGGCAVLRWVGRNKFRIAARLLGSISCPRMPL